MRINRLGLYQWKEVVYNGGIGWTTYHKIRVTNYDKQARDESIYNFNIPNDEPEFETNQYRWPQFLDQWEDGANIHSIWTDLDEGYYIHHIATTSAYKMILADSLIIKMQEPTITSPSDVTDNGYIKVRATGTDSDTYDFTLNLEGGGTVVNSTGIFEDVPAGNHTIDVDDPFAVSPIAASLVGYNVEVKVARDYQPRYICTFQDMKGEDVEVTILRDGYQGVAEEICMGGNPVTLTSDIIGDDFVSGIVPMDIQVEIRQDYDGQYDDMFNSDVNMWAVRVRKTNDDFDITGLLMVEQTNVPHKDFPIVLQIDAVAGLTNMGKTDIEGWSGIMSFIDVIAAIQTQYNTLQYDIRDYVGVREESDPSTYLWSTLDKYKVNAASFNGRDPKDAINSILNTFGCSLTHSWDNKIHIQTLAISTLVGQTIQGAQYTNYGDHYTTYPMLIDVIDVRSPAVVADAAHYINSAQAYGYVPKVGKFSYLCDFKSVVEWEADMDSTPAYSNEKQTWFYLAQPEAGTIELHGRKYWNYKEMWDLPSFTVDSLRLYGFDLRLNVEFEWAAAVNGGNETMKFSRDFLTTIFSIGEDDCLYDDKTIDRNLGYRHGYEAKSHMQWEKWEKTLTTFKEGGYIRRNGLVRAFFYGLWMPEGEGDEENSEFNPNYSLYRNYKIQVDLPEDHEEQNLPHEVDFNNEGSDIGEITIDFDDAPSDSGYGVDIGGVIVKEDLSLTNSWQGYAQFAPHPFKEYLAENTRLLRDKNIRRLTGALSSDFPKIGEVIYDQTVGSGFFMIQTFSYDVKFNILDFSSLEMSADSGNLLLENDDIILLESGNKIKTQ